MHVVSCRITHYSDQTFFSIDNSDPDVVANAITHVYFLREETIARSPEL